MMRSSEVKFTSYLNFVTFSFSLHCLCLNCWLLWSWMLSFDYWVVFGLSCNYWLFFFVILKFYDYECTLCFIFSLIYVNWYYWIKTNNFWSNPYQSVRTKLLLIKNKYYCFKRYSLYKYYEEYKYIYIKAKKETLFIFLFYFMKKKFFYGHCEEYNYFEVKTFYKILETWKVD